MVLAILFDSVGAGEWFVLLAVILVVVGPKRLPETARTLGRYYARLRHAAESFRRQLLDMDAGLGRTVGEIGREAERTVREIEKVADVGGN